jgi:ABC-2 type transport system ATP-binding protein
MKQKLALACTLIHTPKIIFLDEPTTGVDPVSRRDFWKILQSLLKQGITIVMTTPYLDEAERCTRVGLMHDGMLLHVDTPERLKGQMTGEVVEIVSEDVRGASRVLKTQGGVREVQTFGDRLNIILDSEARDFPAVRAALERAHIPVKTWRKVAPSLENVFISLLTKSAMTNHEVQA